MSYSYSYTYIHSYTPHIYIIHVHILYINHVVPGSLSKTGSTRRLSLALYLDSNNSVCILMWGRYKQCTHDIDILQYVLLYIYRDILRMYYMIVKNDMYTYINYIRDSHVWVKCIYKRLVIYNLRYTYLGSPRAPTNQRAPCCGPA